MFSISAAAASCQFVVVKGSLGSGFRGGHLRLVGAGAGEALPVARRPQRPRHGGDAGAVGHALQFRRRPGRRRLLCLEAGSTRGLHKQHMRGRCVTPSSSAAALAAAASSVWRQEQSHRLDVVQKTMICCRRRRYTVASTASSGCSIAQGAADLRMRSLWNFHASCCSECCNPYQSALCPATPGRQ
jgi:hypothetical protein